jgi:hypothetical protein
VAPSPVDADPILGPLLVSLRACICAELAAAGRPVCPCACCIVWGDGLPPADYCDCQQEGGQGQAWVRAAGWAPRDSTARRDPVSVNRRSNCFPQMLRVTIEAGVYRCVSSMQTNTLPANCDDRQNDAIGLVADARTLRRALYCCEAIKHHAITFGGQWPTAVRGGCAGVYMSFAVDLDRPY